MSRIDIQRDGVSDIVADVRMYETADGGRVSAAMPGWGCLLMISKDQPLSGWDALPLLRDTPLQPGEQRRLGFVFLSPDEAVETITRARHFYLWDGRFIGEATVIANSR